MDKYTEKEYKIIAEVIDTVSFNKDNRYDDLQFLIDGSEADDPEEWIIDAYYNYNSLVILGHIKNMERSATDKLLEVEKFRKRFREGRKKRR